ncbi:CLUMA_CG009103, isoform A [Clunio marinus]|uniref:CLUMA_CG009103, isoform A n=1 Tax=Clunio marinus TaxID=568069 RepID=A0A1J1I5S4_9DIPT|nr:CLUMA_CG009103, isoform A [Clunio marinus]
MFMTAIGNCSRVIQGFNSQRLGSFINSFVKGISTGSALNMDSIKIATYEEVKDLPNHPEKLLIDVREPTEISETGSIPTSINIPLGQVRRSFSDELSDREFEILYHVKKPKLDDYLIFTCRTGNRSNQAIQQILPLVSQVEQALKSSSEEFKAKYQHEKPSSDQEIIFHCKIGGRAQKGAEQAASLGFTNVRNYKGSWTEWAQKENL